MPAQGYNAPRPIEVWHLPDPANASIPDDIRQQFQCDEHGRVLFFTAPPQATEPKTQLHHTAKYLAYKAKREEMLKEKRKRDAATVSLEAEARKRVKNEDAVMMQKMAEAAKKAALETMEQVLADATVQEYKALYGEKWKEGMERELQDLERKQAEAARLAQERERVEQEWEGREKTELAIRGLGNSLDFSVQP